MKRKFLSNLLLLLFLNLLIKPFWVFGIDRTVQNLIGSTEYGMYFSLFSFSLLINILLDFGVTNFNNRTISQNPAKINTFFFNIVALKLFLAIIYIAIAFTMALAFGYEKCQMKLLLLLVVNQALSSFVLYLRSNLSGLQLFTTDSLLSVLDRCLMIILCSLAIWGNLLGRSIQIIDFVHIQTVSYLVAIFVIGVILLKKVPSLRFRFDKQATFHILKQSLPFAVLFFLMSVYTRMDSVMLERMLPDGKLQAGIYAQSFRILDALSMFAFLFPTLLLPMFSRLLGDRNPVEPLIKLSSGILFVTAAAISISCCIYSKPIIDILYHDGGAYSSEVFSILIFSFIPISITYIFGTLLTANGNLRYLNYVAAFALVLNCFLNLMLIPSYQCMGAAWSSLITQSLVAIAQVVLCYRTKTFQLPRPEYKKYITFVILTFVCMVSVHFLPVTWLIKFLGMGILIGLMGFLSKIISVKQFISSVRQQRWDL